MSGISFLVRESVPLCLLVAGDEVESIEAEDDFLLLLPLGPEAEPVEAPCRELPEAEAVEAPCRELLRVVCLVEPVEAPCRELLRDVCLVEGSRLVERPLIVCL